MKILIRYIIILLPVSAKAQFLLEEWSTEPLAKDPVTYEQLEQIYDTLYPVADGYFITHNNNYWGVVDSSGAVFLPFRFDGILWMGNLEFLCTSYRSSHSLNTGIPRYVYEGVAATYTETGWSRKKYTFHITVEFIADYFFQEHVISQGPYFFLPDKHRQKPY
ncbi:MAG: hypothetical protein H6548_03550 [Chitinophagales bacterium]|nr:hypothetical protein [Chitinophagales bacterium]MCB9021171.1 hypothetical protein [Chitinophagales bacterium]HPE96546.1 hypothetical protein [Chitinophagales bacterium]HPR28294.1 hypothetical protein [Chitinophagales bacterium]HQU39809.1 hypothetical protein [Chitinophagales bacterium]